LKDATKARVISYGFSEGADLRASNYHILETGGGITFKVDYENKSSIPVRLFQVFGKHNVYPALAALAVGHAAGLNFVEMGDSLHDYKSPAGRLRLLKGVKESSVLDDSYNASPIATRAALEVLAELQAKRKIVVLGDMLELGKYALEAHKSIAEFVMEAGAEMVFTVGPRSKFLATELRELGFDEDNIFEFSTSDEAAPAVKDKVKEGDLILVKGSQSMRMEKVVEEIMAQPEKKAELLVRQEKEWQNKP
jgi:UDP-N-acetylmuramoyl-tripeptide--D-alanyl-D-alanine ligase